MCTPDGEITLKRSCVSPFFGIYNPEKKMQEVEIEDRQ
jgi:hypothetical protein